tara:strand:- start:3035 stop:3265 length:231 start_codon:yes stop_codon:yes gene_type:complete
MSHPVNDQIADDAIDQVAAMSDHQVLNSLFEDHGIATPISGKMVNQDDLAILMDAKRDQLTDLVYQDLIERPGPHG